MGSEHRICTCCARRRNGSRLSVARKKKKSKAGAGPRTPLTTFALRSAVTEQVTAATAIKDKSIAVASAIDDQLTSDGRAPDADKVMADDYHYTLETISTFLRGVRKRLAANDPPFKFKFDEPFAKSALEDTVAALTGDVDAKTI
jgi:hypothetical protein